MESVNPSASPSPHDLKVPSSQAMYDLFKEFIGLWLRTPVQQVDRNDDDIPFLPNERGLLFTQPMTGILVLRASDDLGKSLAKLTEVKDPPHDLFVEMVVLFWHKFVSKLWQMDSRTLGPVLFKKSLPMHWPDRKADAYISVLVLNQPIGIRLWTHLTQDEMIRWNPRKK